MDKYLFYTFRVKGLERDLKATYITGANKGGISRRRNYYINIIYKLHQVLEAEESRNTKQTILFVDWLDWGNFEDKASHKIQFFKICIQES